MGGLGTWLGLEEVAGDEESLEGGRDDVVDEGVTGRPAALEDEGGGTGDLRERNGEMEDRCDLLLDIFSTKEEKKSKGQSKFCRREDG